ncbi:hypothetical protein M0R36_11005 [bacterium]|jgi:hypothetical protein|nr:hypothetical protein [bacterium]
MDKVKEEKRRILRREIKLMAEGICIGDDCTPETVKRRITNKLNELAYSNEYIFIITTEDILEVIDELFPRYKNKCEAIIEGFEKGIKDFKKLQRRKR